MLEIESKMRIQLYDKDFNQLSDRLVTQGPEFAKGPKEVHEGPMRIEFSLFEREDVKQCQDYLARLEGSLPLEIAKKKRGRKKLSPDDPSFREEVIATIQEYTDATELMQSLRDEGFLFITLDYLEDLGHPIAVPTKLRRRYKWLVKRTREAKNPLNHRYDLSVLIGFKDNKIVIVSGEEIIGKHELADSLATQIKVPIKFKVKFPTYMQHTERAQFRVQLDQLKGDVGLKIPKLYLRWLSEVMRTSPKEIEFPRANSISDLYEKGATVAKVQELLLKAENDKTNK